MIVEPKEIGQIHEALPESKNKVSEIAIRKKLKPIKRFKEDFNWPMTGIWF